MNYGLTDAGFVRKPLTEIRDEIEADIRSALGATLSFAPPSVLSELTGIFAEREDDLWQKLETIVANTDPSSATGAALDQLSALTGTTRKGAAPSTGEVVAVGTNGTLLSVGRVFSVAGGGPRFATTAAKTIATVSAWVASSSYPAGSLTRNDGGKVYFATSGGVAAGSGGPTGTGTAIVDGDVVWSYVATATAAVVVPVEAEEDGPLEALSGTLTVIETAVSGLTSVTNPEDATLGREVETDSELRLRREAELHTSGTATLSAIREAVSSLEDVVSVRVFENVTDATDSNGLPPHSLEVLVDGGVGDDIVAAIWGAKPAGIRTYGTTTLPVLDAEGISHSVSFSETETVEVWLHVLLTVEADKFPLDGEAQVVSKLLTYESEKLISGKDVVSKALGATLFDVSGVLDAEVRVGLTAMPATTATLPMTIRQRAELDSLRIAISVSYGEP